MGRVGISLVLLLSILILWPLSAGAAAGVHTPGVVDPGNVVPLTTASSTTSFGQPALGAAAANAKPAPRGTSQIAASPQRDNRGDDGGDYEWRDSRENDGPAFDWVDIRGAEGATQFQDISDDWNSGEVGLGFNFNYYGQDYNAIRIISNGYITFDLNYDGADYSFARPPSNEYANAAIFANGYDYNLDAGAGGEIWFWTNEQDMAVVEWYRCPAYDDEGVLSTVQLVLDAANGMIKIQFGEQQNQQNGWTNVGFENQDGSVGASCYWQEAGVENGVALGISTQWLMFDGPGIAFSPAELNFGEAFVGEPEEITATIRNNGAEDLVISGIECDDGAFVLPGGFDQEVVLGSGESMEAVFGFDPGDVGEYAADVRILCNAENAEGGTFVVAAMGMGVDPADLAVDPNAIEDELNTGESRVHELTITNSEGGAAFEFTTDIEVTGEPERDDNRRGLRNVNGRNVGPQRDVTDKIFAIFQDQAAWGFYDAWFGQRAQGLEFTSYRNAADLVNVDLGDFDCIWVATGEQSAQFTANWNQNVGRFDDWVDGGGVIFVEQGWNGNHVNAGIGGLVDQRTPQEGLLAPGLGQGGNQANWLVDQMGWAQNQAFPGGSTFHCVYPVARFDNMENSDYYQVIAIGQATRDPGIVWYTYGRGNVIVSGSPIGHQWVNHNVQGRWGNCGPMLIEWMGLLSVASWISVEPEEGVVEGGAQGVLNLTLDAEGLVEGDYTAVLHILNEADEVDLQVNVSLFVIGAPDVFVEWDEDFGFPDVVDFNAAHPDLFNGSAYDVTLNVANEGVAELVVDGLEFTDGIFSSPEAGGFVLDVGDDVDITVTLETGESGVHEASMLVISNDPDMGEYEVMLRGETGQPPIFVIDPGAIEDELFTGEVHEHTLTVTNEGEAPLRFTLEGEVISEPERDANARSLRSVDGSQAGPKRDNPGDLLGQFGWNRAGNVNQYKAGIAYDWDNELMAITTYSPNWIAIVDPAANYQVVREWQPPVNPMGCAWMNGTFYAIGWANNWIYRFDVNGNNLGNFAVNVQATSVAASPEHEVIFVGDGGGARDVYVYNVNAQRLATIARGNYAQYIGNGNQRSLLWVDKHDDGQLWMNTPGRIWQMHVNTNNWQADAAGVNWAPQGIQNGQEWDGLGHDGHNLYYGCYGLNNYRIYDDGNTEAYWLMFEPEEGEIASGESMDVFVTLDAEGLYEGDYTAELTFTTNDPNANPAVVNVAMFVTGAPDILVEWDEDFGFPDVVDFNAAHPDLFNGFPYDVTLNVANEGTADLVIDGIEFTDGIFSSPEAGGFVLGAGEDQDITVTLETGESGVHEAVMMVISNDPDMQEYQIALMGETGAPPIIGIDPGAIEEELFTGGMSEHVLTVTNQGEAPLRFMIEPEIISEPGRDVNSRSLRSVDGSAAGPIRDDAGELIAQFDGIDINNAGQYSSCVGWDPENEQMWVTNYSTQQIAAYTHDGNYANFRETVRVQPGSAMDGAFVGNAAWIMPWSQAVVNKYNAAGQNIGNWQSPNALYGLGWDSEENWLIAMGTDFVIRIFQLDNNYNVGQQIGSIAAANHTQFHGGVTNYGLEWVGAHPDAPLWMYSNNNGQIHQIAVDTENWNCTGEVQAFSVNPANGGDQPYSSVAHDGDFLWASCQNQATIRIYDDGVAEVRWLTFVPEEGELASGEQTEVTVGLNATGLLEGDYIAELHFLSNDPETPDVVVDITLHVTGAADITVEWEEGNGFPNVVDWNTAYADLFSGGPYTMMVTITNDGTADLDVQEVFTDHDFFTVDQENFVLGPEESTELTLTFNAPADQPGDYNATLTLISNDPDEEEFTTALHAEANLPPRIVINPGAIEDELFTGGMAEHSVNVTNEGDAELRFEVDTEIISEPGRDAKSRTLRSVDGRAAGPKRDDINVDDVADMRFAAFQTSSVWGWLDEGFRRDQLMANNITSYRNAADWDNVDFSEFNGVIVGARDNMWSQNYANNMARFEEYVADGGGAYFETADVNSRMRPPGNFVNDIGQSSSNGVLTVSPNPDDDDYSYFAEICHSRQANFWNRGEVIEGSSWLHAGYSRGQFDNAVNAGTIEWYQVIAVQQQNQNNPGAVAYQFGGGTVLTVSHPTGHTWFNFPQDGMWGSIAAEIAYFISTGSAAQWIVIDPTEGALASGESMDVFVTLDATDLLEGEYIAEAHFLSNDPAEPDVVVNVTLQVTGAADITVEWDEDFGFPDRLDWNARYGADVFHGGPYPMTVEIINDGTADLDVQEIFTDNDVFTVDMENVVLGPDESTVLTITFNAGEPGDFNQTLFIISNDPDEEETVVALHAEANNPPIMVLSRNSLEDDLFTGQIEEYDLQVSNEGDVDLNWMAELEIISEPERDANSRSLRSVDGRAAGPQRDPGNPGELIAQFDGIDINNAGQYSSCVGWDPENEQMWVTNYSTQQIAAYTHDGNYANFRETVRVQPGSAMDGAWVGNLEWIMPWSQAVVNKYNAAGQNVGNWQAPNGLYGLGWDSENNWLIAMGTDMIIRIYQLDDNYNVGQQLGSIAAANHQQFHGNVANYGLEWVGVHEDAPLWMYSNNNGQIHQIAVDTENWNCTAEVQAFSVNPANGGDQPYSSVAHDGEFLWAACQNQATIRIYEDGVAELRWVMMEPMEGTVGAGGSQETFITLDATNLLGGEYIADIDFFSNDPAAPPDEADMTLTVTMNVTGVGDIVVEWDEAVGFPDMVDWNAAFADLYHGGPYPIEVTITNEGTDDITINDIFCDNGVFTTDWNPDAQSVLGVEDVFVFNFIFEAAEAGAYEGTMVIESTDPDEEVIEILVRGEASNPPHIELSEEAIADELVTGETAEHQLMVRNTGDDDLDWMTDIVITQEPERDANSRNLRSVDGRGVGPRRDPPEGRLAFFNDGQDGWGNFNAIWQQEQVDMTQYNSNQFANAPIEEFDMIWIREYQSDQFNTNWNNNVARFEDWVDNGGAIYHCVGTNNWAVVPNQIGGLRRNQQGDGNGVVTVTNDEGADNYNYLATLMNWRGGEVLQGSSWSHASYTPNQLDQIENSDWYQVIATGQGQAQRVGVAVYNYGRGYSVVSGTTDSHQYNNWRQQNAAFWGNAMARIPYYLSFLANYTQWVAIEPEEGTVVGGEEQETFVMLNATDLLGGEYRADINFISNDPTAPFDEPDVTLPVTLNVTGVANIAVVPGGVDEEPVNFGIVYFGYPEAMMVDVQNVGTDDLEIFDVLSDDENPDFMVDPEDIDGFILGAGESAELAIWYDPDQERGEGEMSATLHFITNDPRFPEGDGGYPVRVMGTALEAPILVMEPSHPDAEDPLVIDIDEGDVEEHAISLNNDGGSQLDWVSEIVLISEPERDANRRSLRSVDGSAAGPVRDPGNPGELIAQFDGIDINNAGQYSSCVGWDPENEQMWVTNYSTQQIAAYTHDGDYANFQETVRVQPGSAMDGAWVGNLEWIMPWSQAVVNKYNAAGQNVGNWQAPNGLYGLGWDSEENWLIAMGTDMIIRIYQLDDNYNVGQQLGSIAAANHQQFHGNVANYGLEWVGVHADAPLWMYSNNNGQIHQIAVDTENWNCTGEVQAFSVNPANGGDQPYSSVAHDGEFLWAACQNQATIRIYDDGVSEFNLLSLSPEEGSIGSGDSQDVILTVDATTALGGTYVAELHFMSNDPAAMDQILFVEVTVHGRSVWVADPEAMPLVEEAMIEFPDTYVDGEAMSTVTVMNEGSQAFTISEVVIDGDNADDFGTSFEGETEIGAGDAVEFTFFFRPTDIGGRMATVHFITDAMNIEGGDAMWNVGGLGQLGPDIYTDPEEVSTWALHEDVEGSGPVEEILVIGNVAGEGRADLEWSIHTEEIIQERDAARRSLRSVHAEAGPVRDRRGGPDQAGYEWRDNTEADGPEYEWIDARNFQGVQQLQAGDDINVGPFDLGFAFPFYGQEYGQVRVCSNGWVTFGGYNGGDINLPNMPSGNQPNPTIAVLNYDLLPQAGNWFYWTNDEMAIFQWQNCPRFANGNMLATFELILWSNGFAKIQVGPLAGFNAADPMIGYEDANGQMGASIVNRGAGGGIIQEGLAIGFGPEDVWGIPWLTVDPTEGTNEQGTETEVTLTFDPAGLEIGDYFGKIIIESNDPDENPLEVIVNFNVSEVGRERQHFVDFDEHGGENHSLLVTGVSFDGEPVPSLWEVGVFTPDDVLCGAGLWLRRDLGIAVWGADGDHANYFEAGDMMSVRVWDPDADMEWNGRAVVEEGDMRWVSNGFTVLSIEAARGRSLDVNFANGWNLISINVRPTDEALYNGDPGPEIIPMMAQLRPEGQAHRVLLMKNERGNFYAPAINNFNNIPYWNLAEGYQVKVNGDVMATWEGEPIAFDADVPISASWNMIAYFPTYQLNARPVSGFRCVAPILQSVVIAKDGAGNFMIPSRNFSNMAPWRETQGYQINVSQAVTLNYLDEGGQAAALTGDPELSTKGHWADLPSTGSNMSVLITGITGLKLTANDQVGAFNAAGKLVGVGRVTNGSIGLAVWGDDPSTDKVDGLVTDEAFTLKLWIAEQEVEVNLSVGSLRQGKGLVYEIDGFTVLAATVEAAMPTVYSLGQNFPNPFNAVTRLSFGVPEASKVSVRVFDVAGRTVATLVDGELEAGYHNVVWNGESISAGVYIVKMEAPYFSAVRKVTLVK